MERAPDLSIVICSHDGSSRLPNVLRCLQQQTLSQESLEILVVDNASTDDTAAVTRSHQSYMPNLRYAREDQLGLSHARNLGLQQARADFIAFLDDDAEPSEAWADTVKDTFQKFSCAAVCGPVVPIWPGERPQWLDDTMLSVYSAVDWGPTTRPLAPTEWLVGTNMAFSREALAGDRFNPHLGRRGRNLVSDEETELVDRLRERGHQVIYQPAARVKHHIHADRLARAWYLRRMYWQGYSQAVRTEATRSLYVVYRLKEIADTLIRPQSTYVAGATALRRFGHVAEQAGKMRGILA